MADNEFQVESIGAVYAQALINEGQKQNALAEITDDVRGIGQLLKEDEAFFAFTQALTIGEDERLNSLKKIFEGRVHPLTLNVLQSLARRDRLMFLRGLVEAFETILKEMSGHVDVELICASELNPGTLERIKQSLIQKAGAAEGKAVDLKIKIDPSLIGGITLRIDDTLIDGSVATQLAKMEEQLKSRGIGQLQGRLNSVVVA
ncbi:MAG TPA: ATP synthase F1 subunit delta [Phycisphaerae bacterium]|nr:ATP synthase F1 subunit delta [Phycisphaerae bacterium]